MSIATTSLPAWAPLVSSDTATWQWRDGVLVHSELIARPITTGKKQSKLHTYIVGRFYAAQKNSKVVDRELSELLSTLDNDGKWGLNFGAGGTNYHPRLINLDIMDAANIQVQNTGLKLPFKDNSLDLVITQEVLEHVDDPFMAVAEIHRVLKPGGKVFCQVPFIIGYHPGPYDFWRFTREAYPFIFQKDKWSLDKVERTIGHGSGFYRILVEFIAVTFSAISSKLYKPVKGLSAILFYPLQWLDCLTDKTSEPDRIPGGYYCIATKL